MTYALLQLSLDQTISRQEMEEASVAVPSVARADCARLQRELFGVVVKGLEHADALAFQAALQARGFPTEIIDDSELPALATPVRGVGLRVEADAVVNVDLYGREQRYLIADSVFLAGGFLMDWTTKSEQKLTTKMVPRGKGGMAVELVTETQRNTVETEQFRLELFVAREPWRLQWVLGDKSVLRINSRLCQLRDRWDLNEFLKSLQGLFPPERINRGIRDAGLGVEMVYPSERAFEEEIIWRFHRLTR